MTNITAYTKVEETITEERSEVFVLELDAAEAAALTRLLGEGPWFQNISPAVADVAETYLNGENGLYWRLAAAIEERLGLHDYIEVIPELFAERKLVFEGFADEDPR